MKLVICAAFAALTLYAQDSKVVAKRTPEPAPKEAPAERSLTEVEVLKFQLASAKIQLIQDRYKVAELQKELEPLTTEQNAIATAACKSVGIPEPLIQTQCKLNLGTTPGPDGKPTQAWVRWEKPAAPAAPTTGTK